MRNRSNCEATGTTVRRRRIARGPANAARWGGLAPRASLVGRVTFAFLLLLALAPAALADRVKLVDGTTIDADEIWEDAQGVWYRRGGVTHWLERARVRAVERDAKDDKSPANRDAAAPDESDKPAAKKSKSAGTRGVVKVVEGEVASNREASATVWIYLVGGARMEVDEATEAAEGVWYRRGVLSIFVERSRIERVERERPEEAEAADGEVAKKRTRRERYWTTGSARLDALIRQNGAAHGVDPYLIFCVMEQESHFNSRAVSPKGAMGLMQLMPGTAARFGVRNAHDPAQNVRGGTRYLKQLLNRFNGRVELVLASYNAGEGAVEKYGRRVPPYAETRNYVRRISARYRQGM
ncbi:MAG TPA: lytic transglycosylase domain-containing protein [Pyrinomonadaceae bacterium]|nr:lytic transglycosylase domain-containing protein [Pyrinomonadaceae bacterium]